MVGLQWIGIAVIFSGLIISFLMVRDKRAQFHTNPESNKQCKWCSLAGLALLVILFALVMVLLPTA